ncbi:hypothetical protein CR513_05572, partial [Mucuna pruriens]
SYVRSSLSDHHTEVSWNKEPSRARIDPVPDGSRLCFEVWVGPKESDLSSRDDFLVDIDFVFSLSFELQNNTKYNEVKESFSSNFLVIPLPPTTVNSSCSVPPVMARIRRSELSSSVPAHPDSTLLIIIPILGSLSCVRSSLSDHRIEVSWNKELKDLLRGVRNGKYTMCWRVRKLAPIWKAAVSKLAQHTTPRFGLAETMLGPSQANYQHQGQRYQAPPVYQQLHQQMPLRENNSTMEDLILEFQQNFTATIHDLKMQVGQLADTMRQMQSADYRTIPS